MLFDLGAIIESVGRKPEAKASGSKRRLNEQASGPGSTQTLTISGLLNDYIGDIRGFERYGDDTIDYYAEDGGEWYINGEDIIGYFLRELHPYIADFNIDGPKDQVTVTLADAQTLSDLMYIEMDDPELMEVDAEEVIGEADSESGASRRTKQSTHDLAKEDEYAVQSNIFHNQILPHIEEDWGLQAEIEALNKEGASRKDWESFIDEVWVELLGWSPYWEEGIMDEMLGAIGAQVSVGERKRSRRRRIGEGSPAYRQQHINQMYNQSEAELSQKMAEGVPIVYLGIGDTITPEATALVNDFVDDVLEQSEMDGYYVWVEAGANQWVMSIQAEPKQKLPSNILNLAQSMLGGTFNVYQTQNGNKIQIDWLRTESRKPRRRIKEFNIGGPPSPIEVIYATKEEADKVAKELKRQISGSVSVGQTKRFTTYKGDKPKWTGKPTGSVSHELPHLRGTYAVTIKPNSFRDAMDADMIIKKTGGQTVSRKRQSERRRKGDVVTEAERPIEYVVADKATAQEMQAALKKAGVPATIKPASSYVSQGIDAFPGKKDSASRFRNVPEGGYAVKVKPRNFGQAVDANGVYRKFKDRATMYRPFESKHKRGDVVTEAVAAVLNTKDTAIALDKYQHDLTPKRAQSLVQAANPGARGKVLMEASESLQRLVSQSRALKYEEFYQNPVHALCEAASGPADMDAAEELRLFIDNDADLYRQMYQPQVKNLLRKQRKGTYDSELAVKLFMYLATEGARKYVREHGSPGSRVDSIFNKNTRLETAKMLRDHFEAEAEYGNYDNWL